MWKHEKELVDATDVKNWYETDMFYENFRKVAPKLKRLYTTGGEPTLIKANYKMMQMLLDAGNTDCAIEFTSNMVAWNYEFYSRLEKFKNVEIQMSLDGAGDVGAYVRYPSDMNRVKENVMKAVEMASSRPNWKIKCYTVLQALNYRHIVPVWEMLREAADTHAKHIDWWPITLYSPPQLSLAAIPMEARLLYLKEFKLLAAEFNSTVSYFRISENTMTPCIDSIKNPAYDPELHENLIRYVKVLDKSRDISGIELFKTELAK
jgi:sulfatase maturation enzyme AslB (radical SAM superfamily)